MATSAIADGERRLLLNLANVWRQMANDVRMDTQGFKAPLAGWSTDASHLLRQEGLQNLQPVQSAVATIESQDGPKP